MCVAIAALVFLYAPLVIVGAASLSSSEFFDFPPRDISLTWYQKLFERAAWRDSILVTLVIAGLTALASTVIGTLGGIGIAKLSAKRAGAMVALSGAPLVVPTIILGIAFYQTALSTGIVGNLLGFIIANTLMTAPLVTLLVASAARGIDQRIEFASASLGASPGRTLTRVVLPIILPVAVAGAALSFLLTVDEVVISSFLVGPAVNPVAVRMFGEIQAGSTPLVIAMSTFLVLISLVSTIILVATRKLGTVTRTGV
jgi:ABC-type spermidine/putrescine transport system permease subunit II